MRNPSPSAHEDIYDCRVREALRVVTLASSGIGSARNAGIQATRGPSDAFMDSGDRLVTGPAPAMLTGRTL